MTEEANIAPQFINDDILNRMTFRASFDENFSLDFQKVFTGVLSDPEGDQISLLGKSINYKEGVFWDQIYEGTSLIWQEGGILKFNFENDFPPEASWSGQTMILTADIEISDGTNSNDQKIWFRFSPNEHSLNVTDITLEADKTIKFLMDNPVDVSIVGDGSPDNELLFENINLYADGLQFRFDGKASWVGDGYSVELPTWVPDGDLIFLPHTQIARIEGSGGRIPR